MSIPSWLAALVDDAAIFPPGNAPMEQAVTDHGRHQESGYADLVGGFVVSDTRLPELTSLLDSLVEGDRPGPSRDPGPLAINLVVTGGAGAIEGAVRWATRADHVELRALEFALRDEEDLAHNAKRLIAAVDAAEVDCPVYVEPPKVIGAPTAGWLAALDELAARELRLKLRCGGATPDLVPTPEELAVSIESALDRELPFKCTAGLHRAVRHEGGHGFLNVLVATRVNLDGGDTTAALESRSGPELLSTVAPESLARTRRWFTSFGSCSITEPLDDLVALGLVEVLP